MAENVPDNPYPEEKETTVYAIGRGISLFVIVAFFLMVLVPVVLDHLTRRGGDGQRRAFWYEVFSPPGYDPNQPDPAKKNIVSHLRWLEKGLESAPYAVAMRQGTQQWLTREYAEGSQKVFVGYDGWLYYNADLKALTGYGPLKQEPFSVMKDPALAKLPAAGDCIVQFAAQLKERGVKLLFVPVPLKPMIHGESILGEVRRVTAPGEQPPYMTHPDAAAFYDWLRKQGVDVLDLTLDMAKLRDERKNFYYLESTPDNREIARETEEALKERKAAFLKQDTHWSYDAMLMVAGKISNHVKATYPDAFRPMDRKIVATDGAERSSMGELVKLLDVKRPGELFAPEQEFLRMVPEGTEDRRAPMVLLGDSFVNIFHDPSIGFGPAEGSVPKEDASKPMHAGLAQHLSKELNQPLDIIAQNGRGATGVRQELARRYDDEIRAKKLVIWVIAARDVLLSRTAAHQASIQWDYVRFNPNRGPDAADTPAGAPAPGSSLVVEASLTLKSPNQEVNGTPYRDALHGAVYEITKVMEGELKETRVVGIQWTFKDKVMQPTASLTTGKKYRLTLVPWETKKELQGVNLEDQTDDYESPRYFVEKAEVVE